MTCLRTQINTYCLWFHSNMAVSYQNRAYDILSPCIYCRRAIVRGCGAASLAFCAQCGEAVCDTCIEAHATCGRNGDNMAPSNVCTSPCSLKRCPRCDPHCATCKRPVTDRANLKILYSADDGVSVQCGTCAHLLTYPVERGVDSSLMVRPAEDVYQSWATTRCAGCARLVACGTTCAHAPFWKCGACGDAVCSACRDNAHVKTPCCAALVQTCVWFGVRCGHSVHDTCPLCSTCNPSEMLRH